MAFSLTGRIYRDEDDPDWVLACSRAYKMTNIPLKPPKIIVGVSVTLPDEDWFKKGVWAFPAILDTGLNMALMLNERHLWDWAVIRKTELDEIELNKPLNNGLNSYDERGGNIWLHRVPFGGRNVDLFQSSDYPLLLSQSSHIRVVADTGGDPYPRLPLLGLQALLANNLTLSVQSKISQFDIKR